MNWHQFSLLTSAILSVVLQSQCLAKGYYGPGSSGAKQSAHAQSVIKPVGRQAGESAEQFLNRLMKVALTPTGQHLISVAGLSEISGTITELLGRNNRVGAVQLSTGSQAGLPFGMLIAFQNPDRRSISAQFVIVAGVPDGRAPRLSYAVLRKGARTVQSAGKGIIRDRYLNPASSQLSVDQIVEFRVLKDRSQQIAGWIRTK